MSETPARSSPSSPGLLLPCAAIFLIALALRLAYAYTRPIPISADAAYYLHVAENLYHGRGFVADYVWNYLAGLPEGLPVPSNSYWMPGTSVITAAAFAVAREASLRAAQWPSLIFGALLCALTAWIAGALTRRREAALLAGAAAAVNYYLVELSLFPDHFMLNAVLVNLSLLALWSAWRGRSSRALLAGALAGLAYLTRSDGAILILVVPALALAFPRRTRKSHAVEMLVYFFIAFSLVSAPWWIRQTLAFGHPSGANPLRTAFLTDYNDLFRLDQSHLNLRDYLQTNQRFASLFKGYVLYRSLRVLAKAVMLLGLLALAALFLRTYRKESAPWLIYTSLGLLVPAALVPYPAVKGGSWHLMPAFLPLLLALGSAFAIHLIDAARRSARPGLLPAAWLLAALSLASGAYWYLAPPPDAARASKPLYPPIAAQAALALGPAAGPVLTDNAWGLYHVARLPCAQFPTDGAEAALKIADAIGASHLITSADATDQFPSMGEIVGHPRFQPLARYSAGETSLLVYRLLPP